MKMRERPLIHDLYDRVNVTMTFSKMLMNEVHSVFGELDKDIDYNFVIKKAVAKRSLDANAYAWVLIGKLAKHYKTTNTEMYKSLVREMPTYEVICVEDKAVERFVEIWESNGIGWTCDLFDSKIQSCTNIKAHYGSSVFNSSQMAQFIDSIIHECNNAGVYVDEEYFRHLEDVYKSFPQGVENSEKSLETTANRGL